MQKVTSESITYIKSILIPVILLLRHFLKHKDSSGEDIKNKTCSSFDKTQSKVFLNNFYTLNRVRLMHGLIINTPCKVHWENV